jgi:hypothetical protein
MSGDLFSWARAQPEPAPGLDPGGAAGAALRDSGMALASQAQEHERPGWGERAYQAIVAVARLRATVHVDDVLRIFREQPEHPNAWGSVWQKAIRDGVITRSGTVRETQDRRKHRHRYPVYASAIFGSATR